MSDDEEEFADYGGEFHRWMCPECYDVNEEEHDPRGEMVECAACYWEGTVRS